MVELSEIKKQLASPTLKHRKVGNTSRSAPALGDGCVLCAVPRLSSCNCVSCHYHHTTINNQQEGVKQLELQLSSKQFLRQLDVNTLKLWPEDKIQRKQGWDAQRGADVSCCLPSVLTRPMSPATRPAAVRLWLTLSAEQSTLKTCTAASPSMQRASHLVKENHSTVPVLLCCYGVQ